MEGILETLRQASPLLAYISIFAASFLDSFVLVGLAVNGIALFTVALTLYLAGSVSIYEVALFSFLGATSADNISFLIGHVVDERPLRWRLLAKHEPKYQKGVSMVRKHGVFAVVAGRFFAVTRPVIPFVCGVFKLKYTYFLLADILGCLTWVSFWSFILFKTAQ